MLESIKNDCRVLRYNLQALFLVNPVAKRYFTRDNRAVFYLAVKDHANPLPTKVRLILRNGEPEVDVQPPASRGSVVLLLGGQPAAVVGVQNLHDLVIVGHRTKPAVQAGKQNQVNLVLFHVLQHPQEVGTLIHSLPGGLCRVNVGADDHPAPFPGVLLQVFLLGLQRQALDRLLLAADTDIQINAQRCRRLFFAHNKSCPLKNGCI